MRRRLFLISLLILMSIVSIYAEPYKPKPILFIHGIDGNSKCWGVSPVKININGSIVKGDSIDKDSIIDGRILPVCLEKLIPMVWNWDTLGYDDTYTIPGGVPGHEEPDPAYPNKTFLEIVNFHDNNGNVSLIKLDSPLPHGSERGYMIMEYSNTNRGNISDDLFRIE